MIFLSYSLIPTCSLNSSIRRLCKEDDNPRMAIIGMTTIIACWKREDAGAHTGIVEEGKIMKNETFNQMMSANLSAMYSGFSQYVLAKATAALLKKTLRG